MQCLHVRAPQLDVPRLAVAASAIPGLSPLQETQDLRVKAWAMDGASQRDRVDRWFEHGAAPSAAEVKAGGKRAKMLRAKLAGDARIVDGARSRGSILVATHNAYRDLWSAGQPGHGGGVAPTAAAQALQRVVEGAGVVIIDEAHCIRNASTTVRHPRCMPCSIGQPPQPFRCCRRSHACIHTWSRRPVWSCARALRFFVPL